MTLADLVQILGPIADQACASDDQDVVGVSVVLCALLGTIDGGVDRHVFELLVAHAGALCEHQREKHTSRIVH